MVRLLWAGVILFLLPDLTVTGAPTTRPATQPVPATRPVPGARPAVAPMKPAPANDPLENMKRSWLAQKANLEKMPVASTHKRWELLRLTTQDGVLKPEWLGPRKLTTSGHVRIKVEDSEALWTYYYRPAQNVNVGNGQVMAQPEQIMCSVYDFGQIEGDGAWMVSANVNSGQFYVNAQGGIRGELHNLNYHQFGGSTRLMLMKRKDGKIDGRQLQYQGGTLTDLRTQAPEEVRRFLSPVLRLLAGEDLLRPGAADVYRVFDAIAPDLGVVQKIEALMPDLDSPLYAQRESASAALGNLGRAGVLAALRWDPKALSEEQKTRLGTFISRHARHIADEAEVARARGDADFLIDCLLDEDPAVRQSAMSVLRQQHPSAAFDMALQGDDAARATDALREAVRRQRAATKPAA